MARKLPALLQRALDAPALASVAYGEIASSIYFALGVVACTRSASCRGARPRRPAVPRRRALVRGGDGRDPCDRRCRHVRQRRRFQRLCRLPHRLGGFLDYLIVIALSALFFPHYLGLALGIHAIARHPGDVISACVPIALIGLSRLFRRTRLYSFGIAVPLLDLVTRCCSVVSASLCSSRAARWGAACRSGRRPTSAPSSPSRFRSRCWPTQVLATVANYAEEIRSPGRDLPRSLFSAIGCVVLVYVLIALVGLFGVSRTARYDRARRRTRLRSPLVGSSRRSRRKCLTRSVACCGSTSA